MARFFLILFNTVVFCVVLINNGVAQDAPAKPKSTAKSSAPKKEEAKGDGPRIKTPKEIAYDLCLSANSLKKLGKHDDAIKTYSEALETYPEYYTAFLGRAGSKFLKLDFQGALSDYSAGIDMMENMIEQHETQAKIKKVFGDVTGEKIELDAANAIIPSLADGYFQRGNVQQFLDDKSSACQDIKKAKELGYLQIEDAMKNICGQ